MNYIVPAGAAICGLHDAANGFTLTRPLHLLQQASLLSLAPVRGLALTIMLITANAGLTPAPVPLL